MTLEFKSNKKKKYWENRIPIIAVYATQLDCNKTEAHEKHEKRVKSDTLKQLDAASERTWAAHNGGKAEGKLIID